MEQRTDHAAKEKLVGLIKGVNIAMLTTRHGDGSMHSRPMATIEAEFDGHLFFFTDQDAELIKDIEATPDVNLSYADEHKQNYVSVTGKASVSQDRARIKELWSEMARPWYPKGAEDPRLTLVTVEVTHAEYWDAPSSTMLYAYGYAKALATGERPKNVGDTATVKY